MRRAYLRSAPLLEHDVPVQDPVERVLTVAVEPELARDGYPARVAIHAYYFFFSSRRRHTRYIGDWSSDVCSSDLDAEALPFEPDSFDVVVSQYGHIFAPRPDVAAGELLRVVKPGGVIAFSTCPPEDRKSVV